MGLVVQLFLDSKGGGVTQVDLWIGPGKFEELALAMVAADKRAAAEALSAGVSKLA